MRQIKKMSVYKEVHRKRNGEAKAPLHEGIRGDKYRCCIVLVSGRIIRVSGDDINQLRTNVDKELKQYPSAEVEDISFEPPEGTSSREFVSIGNEIKFSRGRRYSSGTWMQAVPCPLDKEEIGQFNAPESD